MSPGPVCLVLSARRPIQARDGLPGNRRPPCLIAVDGEERVEGEGQYPCTQQIAVVDGPVHLEECRAVLGRKKAPVKLEVDRAASEADIAPVDDGGRAAVLHQEVPEVEIAV